MKQAWLIDLGTQEFQDIWQLQLNLVAQRASRQIPDVLLLVEHPHVYTMGRKSHDPRSEIRVRSLHIECHAIERGGAMTYHGPGQLVGYPILGLQDLARDLYGYLRNLEEVLMRVNADFQISTRRRPGFTGVWTADKSARKIASIGVAVRRWVTYHGFALNVNTDLSFFRVINPCGLDGAVITSMADVLQEPVAMEAVKASMTEHFSDVFGFEFITPAHAPALSLSGANITEAG